MFYFRKNKRERKKKPGKDKSGAFDLLKEGDIDPVLGKKIEVLIENGGDFIVYLDSELNIQYAVSSLFRIFSASYGEVLNKVAELDGLADLSCMTKRQVKKYRCMIGAAIARMYENNDKTIIFEMLDKSEYFLKSRVTETARIWYLSSASFIILFLVCMYIIYISFIGISNKNSFEFISCILSGAGGAYLSLIMNTKKITVNPSSGRVIHFFESITRLIIGMIGSFFVSLLVYSGIINPGAKDDLFINMLIFSFIAGFSERMVPNLIHHFEVGNGSGNGNGNGKEHKQKEIINK
jgi:hypothetical protein